MNTGSQDTVRSARNLRTMLIEPFKQVKFGLYVFVISAAFVAGCGILFFKAFWEQYQHVMGIFNVVDPKLKWELITNDVFYSNAVSLGVLFALYLVTLFFVVFRLTHRYYGPLVSIARFVEQISNGDYSRRVSIRKKDELHDLVEKLNRMADALENAHGSKQTNNEDIK